MLKSAEPLVSIVTPVYNDGPFLAECIESVLAQRYSNWEYIIVDNCSTDSSPHIADSYARRDPRIRVLRTSHLLNATANHNFALQQCSRLGSYCKVVQADDWIFPECLARMVGLAEENPTIGIVGAYGLAETQVVWTGLEYSASIVNGREICRRHFLDRLYIFGSPTSVLYRASLVRSHNPFYNEGNVHNDTEVCFALLKEADFGFVHQILTFTRVRPRSRTAISDSLQTCYGGMLQLLMRYGPSFLTTDELQARMGNEVHDYYHFLGKSLLLGRDKTFWKYHEDQFTLVGLDFSRWRLIRAALSELWCAALDPRSSASRLMRRKDGRPVVEALRVIALTTSREAEGGQ